MVKYAGQRTAQDVFEELRYQLENIGYLPDEYFLMDHEWENGRKIPKDADIFCTTDYGASEGIYIDVYLKWYDEQKNPNTKSFITGKTLGESSDDMDRMFLVGSAITKAFHGDGSIHARYVKIGGADPPSGTVMHLNSNEQQLMIHALIESRNRLMEKTIGVEQLLRRITRSITEYVNEVGSPPLKISDYDRAVLAIQDGNLEAFQSAYPKALEQADALLIHTAGRPGTVGRKMVLVLLSNLRDITNASYLEACKKAVDTGDVERVLFFAEQAENCVKDLDLSLYGEIIGHAYSKRKDIAEQLIKQCTAEQIAAAPAYLLYVTAINKDYDTASALVYKGINANKYAKETISALSANRNEWIMVQLLKNGMQIDSQNYSALDACIRTNQLEAAEILLDRGMDFDKFQKWAKGQPDYNMQKSETMESLKTYWQTQITRPEPEQNKQIAGSMTIGQ